MLCEWNCLSDVIQIALSREALSRASATIAQQAEVLAEEMECGNVVDRGGADALRLFAALVRIGGDDQMGSAGNA